MTHIRTKTVDFAKLDPRARKGDKAEIHGINYTQFLNVQRLINESKSGKDENEKLERASEANVTFITCACHSLTLDGKTIEPTQEDIMNLDTIYYQVLLTEVLEFHAFGENEKN